MFPLLFIPIGLIGQIRAVEPALYAPNNTPTIIGPDTTCATTGGYVYNTEEGMINYLWVVSSGGTVSGGSGTNSIMVTWNSAGAQTVTVSYDGAPQALMNVEVLSSYEVGITISASANPVCAGTSVIFTAIPANGGISPVYHWRVNNVDAGANNPVFSHIPANGDIVTCQLTSDLRCPTGNPANSAPISMIVNPNLPVSIFITASANPTCEGNIVTFSAIPCNGGTSPSYFWKVNGAPVGTNSFIYSYVPATGDYITCELTSNVSCSSGNPATSNMIIMTVSPNLPVSVSITASTNLSCVGELVVFTAVPVNGETIPGYNWTVNGTSQGINNSIFSFTPVNGDEVVCELMSNTGCASGNPANSNSIFMTVVPYAPVSISITASANPVCNGVPVTFTATPVNGGTSPAYQWFVNGTTVANPSAIYTYTPTQGDLVICQLNSNTNCSTGNPATSNSIIMTVSLTGNPSLSIEVSNNPICQGTQVSFMATPVNGGTSPVYQWKVNGVNAGSNSSTYVYSPNNGDVVTCSMISNSLCASGNAVFSNSIVMSVSPVQTVGVSITTQTNPVCQGSTAIFTATAINGGTIPAYQWRLNGGNTGSNSATFAFVPANNDVVTCILTSNALCIAGNPATSNPITMNVSASLPASVSIVASANPACNGVLVEFTATPVNGGTNPTYEWRVNNIPIPWPNSPTFSYASSNDYTIKCILTSNNGCPANNVAISTEIPMTVNPLMPVSISIVSSANPSCQDAFITFTATPVNGGTMPFFQWKVNGVNAGANQATYTYAPVTGDIVTCQLTSSIQCKINSPATSTPIIMVVNPIVTAAISVVTPEDTVCPGTLVTFTANTVNGGTSPVYQWMLNGVIIGGNYSVINFIPVNGDVITCRLTSSLTCVTGNPVTSVPLVIHTNTPLPGSISIFASANPFCQGSTVTFSSSINNGGSSPGYQWKVNGINVGNNPTYTCVPANGDFLTCMLTSSLTCTTGPVTSNPILMWMKTIVPASISINASENPVCTGSSVTFTAIPVNGGSTPAYQWKVNGIVKGSNAITYTYIPENGDVVTCRLTSNVYCVSGNPAISAPVIMVVTNAMPASVSITTLTNPFCIGTAVTFTATQVNGGTLPVYLWKVNGSNQGTNSAGFTWFPSVGDVINCELTSNSSCISGSNPVVSDQIIMSGATSLGVSVTITASANPACQGTPVTFTAIQTNGGTMPNYQWKVNNVNAGTNSPIYTYTPLNGQVITCLVTSDMTCATGNPAVSNPITITISPTVFPTVSITPSLNPVCTGTLVTFTTTTTNPGSSPVYTWRVNGIVTIGATNSTYVYTPLNYDAVTCQLNSNAACSSSTPVISNQVAMIVKSEQAVGVNISTPSLSFCAGSSVTFTASPVNGGTAPFYQWQVNGVPQSGANNSTYIYQPANGDIVKCVLTSNQTCITNNPATSNSLLMTTGTGFPVSVSISADINPICPGTTVIFTAVPTYGGSNPHYQWKVNGNNVGIDYYKFQYEPVVGDSVKCVLTSSLISCVINNPATSNAIYMIVNPAMPVSVWVTAASNPSCLGNSVCYFASVTNGGNLARYRWKVNGNVVSSLINNPSYCYVPANGNIVSCQVISDATCPTPNPCNSNNIVMVVLPISPAAVSISASANPVCEGVPVTYLATPVNGGTLPIYEWKVNGNNAPGSINSPVYSYSPDNTDVVTNLMTSNAYCVSVSVVTSNPLAMTVSPYKPVSVSIAASLNPVCLGSPVTFLATPQHGGTIPAYQWKVNGIIEGANSSTFTYIPVNGDEVSCTLTSNDACTTGNPAISNTINVSVIPTLPVSISIVASATPVCQGELITYTATAVNGGVNPFYQWLVNGFMVGTNSPTYAYVPSSGDVVACHFTANVSCATGNPALSNSISMIFFPYLPVSISINCLANPVCQCMPASFIATPVNGGVALAFHWKVNGLDVGGNQPTFSYNPVNADVVTCELDSDIPCPISNPVTSNSITMSVLVPQITGVTIAVSNNPVCEGTSVIFTATPSNGGSSPVYQWFRNGVIVGTNSSSYTYIPFNGDIITCQIISNVTCVTNDTVISNPITMIVSSDLPASLSIVASSNPACLGQMVTFTAMPVNGGLNPDFVWRNNGIVVGVNSSTYIYSPTNGDIISCQLTSSYPCASGSPASSNQMVVVVNPNLPVSVSITSSFNPACIGVPVTYSATPVNGGISPGYQWKVNGLNVGTNHSTYTFAPVNEDLVSCLLTSSENCVSGSPAASNQISMIIGSSFPVTVSIVSSDNPICHLTPVTFVATSDFGGPSPFYQWKKNGDNVGTNSTIYSYFPADGDVITCTMTSQLTCSAVNPVTSNAITMIVLPIPVSVTIGVTPTDAVCAGAPVTFTSYPVNGGPNPTFLWKVNGIPAGTNSITYTYPPENGDIVTCTLTSNATCASGNTVTSTSITALVDPDLPVAVAITSNQGNTVCLGTTVTFSATTANEGYTPVFQWKVNGSGAGTNSSMFNYTPVDWDIISCVLISNARCATGTPATSNTINMTVNPVLPVSATISADVNPVCAGTLVTFTTVTVNGGNAPLYLWKLNGVNSGTGNSTYSYVPVNGDWVSCDVTSNADCSTGNPATSNSVAVAVNPAFPVGVSITATPSAAVCSGTFVTFNAFPTNGGTTPLYQWKVNGVNVGNSNPAFGYIPAISDVVSCQLTSNVICGTNNPAVSAPLTVVLGPSPVVTYNSCHDLISTTDAQPFKLKGGLPLGGVYSGPGVNSVTGILNPAAAGVGNHQISYSYTNVGLCTSSAFVAITVNAALPFICGTQITDPRDNQSYPTVQIASQCWFAKNLNFGNMVSSASPQVENCTIEKYCPFDLSSNCFTYGGFYQWDELMRFDATPGAQGLCPPAWHVPTMAEWLILLNQYGQQSQAAVSLKDIQPNGFNALLSGILYQNNTWVFNAPGLSATFFWTSDLAGSSSAMAHGLNNKVGSVSDYSSSRGNAMTVRCAKD